jgi:hypothetical protein
MFCTKLWYWLPGLSLGLFGGRLLSELAAGQWGALSWPVAAAITLLCAGVVLGSLATRRLTFYSAQTAWPLLLLWLYLLHPHPDWQRAGLVLLLTGVAGLLNSLPRRLHFDGSPHWPAAGLALTGGLLYLHTLAPGLLPADSGEFQTVAATLGVAHPPGFPLYTLIGHLFTRLPGLTPAYGLNLFAAVSSSLTLYLVYLAAYRLTQRHLAGLIAVLALATATTFWAQATTANVRSLTACLAAFVIYHLIRFRQIRPQGIETADRHLLWAAAGLGLGLTHHASLIFMGLVFGLALLLFDPGLGRTPRRWLRPLLAGLLGLLPLLYLPWRAWAGVADVAGLATWSGFWDHVLARGFRGDFFYFAEPGLLWQRLGVMANVLTFQFNGWLLLGMVLGGLLLLWRDRPLALLLLGSFGLHTLITAVYRAPQTVEYMLPAYIPAVLLLAYGVAVVQEQYSVFGVQYSVWRVGSVVVTAVWLTAALVQGWQHYASYAALSQQTTARDYAQSLLDEAPEGSLILAHWHWYTPLHYLQTVEGQRPDVEITFVFPRGEPYDTTWGRLTREGWENGRPVITTHYAEFIYDNLPPPQPLGEAFLFAQAPLTGLPANYSPLDLRLGDRIHLQGYRLEQTEVTAGQTAVLTLAWSPLADWTEPLTLFAHLVGTDGRIYAQQDLPIRRHPDGHRDGLTLTQLLLTPRPGALPGDYTLFVGGYGTTPLPAAGEERTAVATLSLTPNPTPIYSQNQVRRPLAADPQQQLIGYDWDHTLPHAPRLYLHWQTAGDYLTEVHDEPIVLSPTIGPWGIAQNWTVPTTSWPAGHHYVPLGQGLVWLGEGRLPQPVTETQLHLPQILASSRPLSRDLVISVRLIGYAPEGFLWSWFELQDGIPAMGAIPTLKWIAGSQVRSPYSLEVRETAVPGQTLGGVIRFYDAFTHQPLPILDERLTGDLPGIPLATSHYQPRE